MNLILLSRWSKIRFKIALVEFNQLLEINGACLKFAQVFFSASPSLCSCGAQNSILIRSLGRSDPVIAEQYVHSDSFSHSIRVILITSDLRKTKSSNNLPKRVFVTIYQNVYL